MGITHTCPMGIKVHLPDGPGDYSLVQTIVYRPTPTCPDEASTKARNAETQVVPRRPYHQCSTQMDFAVPFSGYGKLWGG